MSQTVNRMLHRRRVLVAGLGSAASIIAAGCSSSRGRRLSDTPGPVWPHERRDEVAVATPRPERITPLPTLPSRVNPRSAWTSTRPNLAQTNPMVRVERLTVHHDGLDPIQIGSAREAAARIEVIRRSHVENNGWADIGYHYIIDPLGGVWEGRPITLQGAHVRDNNPRNAGVLVLGHFNYQQPTAQALGSLDGLVAALAEAHRIPLRSIATHRELNPTECPGDNLQRHMDQTRSSRGRLAVALA